jgi:sorbitol-specific phosphotransferase system component IIA
MVTIYFDGTEVTSVAGTITGDDQVDGTETEAGSELGTTVTGIVTTTEVGTDDGTLDHEITTIDGELGTVTIYLVGTEVTSVAGTITGDDQVDGTEIEAGTLLGIVTKTVVGK